MLGKCPSKGILTKVLDLSCIPYSRQSEITHQFSKYCNEFWLFSIFDATYSKTTLDNNYK